MFVQGQTTNSFLDFDNYVLQRSVASLAPWVLRMWGGGGVLSQIFWVQDYKFVENNGQSKRGGRVFISLKSCPLLYLSLDLTPSHHLSFSSSSNKYRWL